MAQNRITFPQWQRLKAGQEVETGFPGIVLTAPREPGEYTLYECAEGNTHAGWVFKKTKKKNNNIFITKILQDVTFLYIL